MLRFIQKFITPTYTVRQKPEATDALIAQRAERVCNRERELVKRYKGVHAALLGGSK